MDPFDLVGDVLDDQYRIDECAGEGVLSVVYRGRHLGVDADVAVKCLNLPPTMDEALAAPVAEGFRQGCRLHYRLARGNLHIAQTIASGTTIAPRTGAVVPYLVREWFEGESLAKDFIKRREEGRMGRTLEEVLDLFQGAADALRYAHSQHISHLSLTPSNFFLTTIPLPSQPSLRPAKLESTGEAKTTQRTIKVLDFGVGRIVDATASDLRKSATPSPGLHLLTPAYAAPEQLSAQLGVPGPASDVYVFALVLLEALSDRTVMDGKDTGQIVARALDRKVRPGVKQLPITLPPQVEAIFERALALEPAERYADVGEFWEELLHADVEITSSSRDPSLPPPNFEEEEPTAEMPMEMLQPLAASKSARDSSAEPSMQWEHSPAATARIRGPSLFRRLRHWKTLGAKGKNAAEAAEREEGPISMPPVISVVPGPSSSPTPNVEVPAAPKAPAIPTWRPDPVKPATKAQEPAKPSEVTRPMAAAKPAEPAKPTDLKPTVKVAVVEPAAPAAPAAPKPVTVPPRPATAPMAPRPAVTMKKVSDPTSPKVEPPKVEPPKAEPAKAEPPKPAAPKPPPPARPLPPGGPKRQPTLVMFEHGIDVTAAARTSSPSSPGLSDPKVAAEIAAKSAAPPPPPAEPPPPPAPPAPAASVAPAPPAPSVAPAAPAPPDATPIKTPGKPLPPPPPADVLSALEGMESAPVAVPPAPPSSSPNRAPSMQTAPMPWTVSAPPPPVPPPPPSGPDMPPAPPPPASDSFAAMGPPSARSAPTEVTRAPDSPFGPPSPETTAFTEVPPPRRSRALIATIISFAVVLVLGVVAILASSHFGTKPTVPSASVATTAEPQPSVTAAPSVTASASASASASAAPSASVAPVASVPVLPTQPKFFKNLALKALDKVAKDLSDCRDKKALWGQSAATVYFSNDGTVKDVTIAHPYTGKPQGKCVEDKIRTARMAPFLGKSYPVVYFFVIPR